MGCVMSTAIGCMLCNHSCSVAKLAATLSFFPPNPPSYRVEQTADGECRLVFSNDEMQKAVSNLPHRTVQSSVHQLATKRGETIVLLHFTCPGAQTTLLWSHGNAMDIGEMYFFFMQLSDRLKVNIAAYDYSGYGGSTGSPSEPNAYADILAVHDFLAEAGVEPERHLVLYGQSIGSAPSTWLATRRRVLGLILHTPLLSGLRVLIKPAGCCTLAGCCSPTCVYGLCDPFPNKDRIRRVSCPILLVHGTADQTIECSHTIELYRRAPPEHRRAPYIIKGAGHDNVVEHDPEAYFAQVGAFLRALPGNDGNDSSLPGGMPPQPLEPPPTPGALAARYERLLLEAAQSGSPACASPDAHAASGGR